MANSEYDYFFLFILRMSATERSYAQNFFKVQNIIIQAIRSRKSMKKFAVTDEKIFCFWKKAFSMEKTPKMKFCQKRST